MVTLVFDSNNYLMKQNATRMCNDSTASNTPSTPQSAHPYTPSRKCTQSYATQPNINSCQPLS